MKIKTLLIAFLFLYSFSGIHAQSGKLKVKESRSPITKVKSAYTNNVVKLSNGQLITLGGNYSEYSSYMPGSGFLYLFSEDMKLKKQVELPGSYLKKRISYQELMKFGKKLFVFFTFLNTEQKKEYLFFVQIDPSDLKFEGKPYKVAELPYKGKRYHSGYFDIKFSDDNEYIVVTAINPAQIEKTKRRIFGSSKNLEPKKKLLKSFSFWLLNKEMMVINHRRDFTVESKSGNKLYVKRFRSDSEGNVFVVAENEKRKLMTQKEAKKSGRKSIEKIENLSYSVFRLGKESEDETEYQTDDNLLLMDLNIGFSKDNKYVDLVGILYEEVSGLDVATGIHAARLDKKTFEVVTEETSGFESEMIKKINKNQIVEAKKTANKKKSAKKKKEAKEAVKFYENGITNLNTVIAVTYTPDGGISAILEKQWLEIQVVTTTDSKGNTTTRVYYWWHYGDLVMASNLGDPATEPVMDFIDKNDYSLTWFEKGVLTSFDDANWYLMAQAVLYKVDPETLKFSSYSVSSKSGSGGGKVRTGYGGNNTIFSSVYSIGNSEFVGVQMKSRKKFVMVRLTAN